MTTTVPEVEAESAPVRSWLVRLHSASTLRLDSEKHFRRPASQMVARVSNGLNNDGEHVGLDFTVELHAVSEDEAFEMAAGYAAILADVLSAGHRAAVADPEPLFALSEDDGGVVLAQRFGNEPNVATSFSDFDREAFRDLFAALDRVTQPGQERERVRVERALRHLRRSMLTSDAFDRFSELWIGLEAINPLIKDRYALATTFPRQCKHCGEAYLCKCGNTFQSNDNSSGITYIVETILGLGTKAAKPIRDKRNDVEHSLETLDQQIHGLSDIIQLARRALVAGLADVLGVAAATRVRLLERALDAPPASQYRVTVRLPGAKLSDFLGSPPPQIVLQGVTAIHSNSPEDQQVRTGVIAIQLHWQLANYSGVATAISANAVVPREPGTPKPQLMLEPFIWTPDASTGRH